MYNTNQAINRRSSIMKIATALMFLLVIGSVAGYFVFIRQPNGSLTPDITTQAEEQEIAQALATSEINQEIAFTLPAQEDENPVVYKIEKAELFDEIVVQGQKAKAVPGRSFLILTVKIDNPTQAGFSINSRDYVRLAVPNSEEWLAPEVHNDPVEVQAISTKYTRLGFPVDAGQREFQLKFGELKGEKTTIDVSL